MVLLSYLKYFALSVCFFTLLFSCNEGDKRSIENSAAAFDIKQAEAAIAQSNQSFMKSFKAGDSIGVSNCYTTDAKTMSANMPPFIGREDIKHFISETMKRGIKLFDISTVKIWGDSSMVAEEGTYKILDSTEKQVDKGKYIVLWKPEAGNWKMFRDIWTSSLPVDTFATKEEKTIIKN
ncbi:MAG: ketosteroid isomerase family protein [Ginsengibacter sp.]